MMMADSEMDKWNNRCELAEAKVEDACYDFDDLCEELGFSSEQENEKMEKTASEHRVGGGVGGWIGRV